MTNTLHPWTMYEVARFRDEERLLRAQAAMRAIKQPEERRREPVATHRSDDASWLHGLRGHLHPLRWAQSHHLVPQHVHHPRRG